MSRMLRAWPLLAAVAVAAVLAGGAVSAPAGAATLGGHQEAGVAGPKPPVTDHAAAAGSWGRALEVPGTAALNAGGSAVVLSVSCGSAGNCSAGGSYRDGSGHLQAFVASQVNRRWRTATEVPGSTVLNAGGNAQIRSVACRSAGNCSAGGYYRDGSGHLQAFVVSQVNGTWHTAIQVPGTAALNAGGSAVVFSVSCGSAGNCSAGGFYTDGSGHLQAFVASQVNRRWRTATEVPGTAARNAGGNAAVLSVSCGSAGNCSAGGFYADGSDNTQAFVVSQVNRRWRTATQVPGSAVLNAGGNAQILSVACRSAGNCSAGGFYTDGSGHFQAFVASQVNGTWRTALEVPATAALNAGGAAQVRSVSCGSAGNCSAAGSYHDGSRHAQAFVASQVNGTWHSAIEVPGTAALNAGGGAQVGSVSCGSAGNCSAGGSYLDGSAHAQAFVVSEVSRK